MLKLPPQVDLPALEHEVLQRWEREKVFERSLEQTADGEPWVFYEGPPTRRTASAAGLRWAR